MGTLDFATGLLLIATVLSICYLVLIRPQRTRFLKLQKLTSNLVPGDQIVTAGGILGTVVRNVDPNTVATSTNPVAKSNVPMSAFQVCQLDECQISGMVGLHRSGLGP